jgi:hypothetical protein
MVSVCFPLLINYLRIDGAKLGYSCLNLTLGAPNFRLPSR